LLSSHAGLVLCLASVGWPVAHIYGLVGLQVEAGAARLGAGASSGEAKGQMDFF